MSIFHDIAGWFMARTALVPATKGMETGTTVSPPSSWLGGLGWSPADTNVPVTHLTALQTSAAYAAVRNLSEDLAKLPFRFHARKPDGGLQDAPQHPLTKLLCEPNDDMTPYDFWAFLVFSLVLRGNSYCYVGRNNSGEPIRLLPLPPDTCYQHVLEDGTIYYHLYHKRLGNLLVAAESIIHVKNISIDTYSGISPIAVSQNTHGIAIAAAKAAAKLYAQGSMLRGVLQTDGSLSVEAFTRLRQSWEATYSGNDNAHKVAILEEGLEFQPIAMTAVDSQLLESRQFSALEICRMYRMPPHKLGILDKASYSTLEQQNMDYVSDSLLPIARRFEEAFAQRLLFDSERQKFVFRFDFAELLRANELARAQAAQIWCLNGLKTPNEIREIEGMGPIDGGDTVRVPLNTTPLVASDAATPLNLGKPPTPEPGDANDPERLEPADDDDTPSD